MEYLTGVRHKDTLEISELRKQAQPGQTVKVNGAVHAIRNMGTVAFVILRKREGLLQGVYEEGTAKFDLKDIKEAATIEVEGVLEENEKAPGGIEIRMKNLKILSQPQDEMMPLAISKWKLNTSLEAKFYKQMMVGVFDRVFETAPVFRAEKHNTKRHLNEYTSLDFEMGYIDGFEDIMAMETGYLQYAMQLLKKDYAHELKILGITLPEVEKIPAVEFSDIKEKVSEKYGHKMRNPFDLEPEEEQLISQYAKEEWGSDFVFVTHYPSKKRPFYAKDDPKDPRYTLSFDLLFRGMEITTGGQRIHDYKMLVEKIKARGMSQEGMEQYLDTFKHGMPPHGGIGIGLERLTMKLIGEDNVRETTLFPRDLSRLEP